ncbi:hypothetical protein BSR28_08465 [Boudabousia liubingyangii]|uniref:D-alanyl-D-alanine carboxypeptidase family protein n=1 Tax=Boudabousia liubingyangii TaxID=1921764 RepID=UPI00093EEFFF|nr:hypothetical protein [Boudabousia liubingyangii]OKL46083.1 hypothetical protein BSR28_08465 [Boudabousia liubingyangii]
MNGEPQQRPRQNPRPVQQKVLASSRTRHWVRIFAAFVAFILVILGFFFVNQVVLGQRWQFNQTAVEENYTEPDLNAKAALLINLEDPSHPLMAKGGDTKLPPASLAKLFVTQYAMTILEPLDSVAVGDELALVPEHTSRAQLIKGRYSARQLARAALIPSGSDAAYALAAGAARKMGQQGSPQEQIDFFLEKMHEHLAQQGFKHTYIHEPCGFEPGSYTTANEAAKIAMLTLENPLLAQIVSTSEQVLLQPDGKELTMKTTNLFLKPKSPFYDPNFAGVKTGSLEDLTNLVGLYQHHNRKYLTVILSSDTDENRYRDTNALLRAAHLK